MTVGKVQAAFVPRMDMHWFLDLFTGLSNEMTHVLYSRTPQDECKTPPGSLPFRADGLAFIQWKWF